MTRVRPRLLALASVTAAVIAFVVFLVMYVHATFAVLRRASLAHATRVSADEILQIVRPGDVVFVTSVRPSFMAQTIGVTQGSYWYHAGVIVGSSSSGLCMMHYVEPWNERFFEARYLCGDHGLCVSELDGLVRRYGAGTAFCVFSMDLPVDGPYELIGMEVACPGGKKYDTTPIRSYYGAFLAGTDDPPTLHCNSFVGLFLERLGVLPKSSNPTVAYVPGKIFRKVASASKSAHTFVLV